MILGIAFGIAGRCWCVLLCAYFVMGISGFIEVVGLTLWGYELFANMRVGKKLEKETITLNVLQALNITRPRKSVRY